MNCQIAPGPRIAALSRWTAFLTWLAQHPRTAAVGAVVVLGAAVKVGPRDIAETARLARQAGRHQGRLERDT